MVHLLKNSLLLVLLSCLCLTSALANDTAGQLEKPYWQDIQVISVNKEAPRSSFMTYGDRATALTARYENSPYYQLLNGTWKFYFVDSYRQLPAGITDPSTDTSNWADITVPGNWERGKFWMPISLWNKLFEQAGFQFLCNQSWRDDTLYVYGCDDVGRGTPRLPGVWPSRQTVILLAHNPDTVIALDNGDAFDGVRLACCGHTHGGQVRLPFIGPLFTPSRYNCRFAYGEFRRRKTDTRMIVTSGLGNLSLPWRFRCRREVVFIRFTGC